MRKLIVLMGCATAILSGGCGGGSTPSGGLITAAAQNVVPMVVDGGPAGVANTPFVSVTICAPGTSSCQTIDHIEVDTGSSGLRILSSVLSSTLSLPQSLSGAAAPLVECTQFADGYSWGPVKTADVQIGGEKSSNLPIQIIGDATFAASVPASCSSSGPSENTVQEFGANGILGSASSVRTAARAASRRAFAGAYYSCPTTGCVPIAVALTDQLQTRFGASRATTMVPSLSCRRSLPPARRLRRGSLVFGIGTESNNSLGMATVLTVDPDTGNITTLFANQTIGDSFIDSGSNGLFFPDGSTPPCADASDFYCPTATQNLSGMMQSATGVVSNVSFAVANADSVFGNGTFVAFNDLAGPSTPTASFDWGLPFFYGRNVFVAIEGQSTAAGQGPFVAFLALTGAKACAPTSAAVRSAATSLTVT